METIAIGLFIPLLGTMLGSAFVFMMKDGMPMRLQKSLLGFASGVMVAASIWSLLIPAMEMEASSQCSLIGGALGSVLPAALRFLLGMGFLRPGELTHVLWSMIPETLAFAPLGIGIVPYTLPGSVELADATLEQIRHYDVVLWEKHGTVAVGRDIMDAFDQTDVLCKAAKIYLAARAMGFEPQGMTDEAMQEVQQVFKLPKERIG